jgi:hypothetical protein
MGLRSVIERIACAVWLQAILANQSLALLLVQVLLERMH